MKKGISFGLILSFLFYIAHAQKNGMEYGFQTGINLNTAHGNDALKKYSGTSAGLHIGGHFKINLTHHVRIKAILAYDQNGWVYRSLTFSDAVGNDLGTGDLLEKLNYLNLPLLAEYSFGHKIKYNIDAGIFAGYLLKYTIVRKIKEPTASTQKTSSGYRKSANFGLSAGAEVQIPIAKKITLDLGIRNNLGLSNVYKAQSAADNSVIRINAFSVVTGITCSIK
jgi:Outer membrane protein beta-barrel domain